MKNRRYNTILIVVAVVVILCIPLFYFILSSALVSSNQTYDHNIKSAQYFVKAIEMTPEHGYSELYCHQDLATAICDLVGPNKQIIKIRCFDDKTCTFILQ